MHCSYNPQQSSPPPHSSSKISLATLGFISAILFFIGSGISVYVAYQNVKG